MDTIYPLYFTYVYVYAVYILVPSLKSAGCSGLKRILMLVLAIHHTHCQIREINLLRAKFVIVK